MLFEVLVPDTFHAAIPALKPIPSDAKVRQCSAPPAAIYLAVGGGGLIAGVGAYVKALWPDVQIIGVEPLDADAMHRAAQALVGEHDFSSFRAAGCQSKTPWRQMHFVEVKRYGPLVVIDIQGNAFLHHMIRNILGCLIMIGDGRREPDWIRSVLAARDRDAAAPTFSADGLYFLGPRYDAQWGLPVRTALFDSLPGAPWPSD